MWNLSKIWINLRSSLWFIPSLMILGAILLAVTLVEMDAALALDLERRWPRWFGANAEGARGILSAIAGSTITVAGVIFSIVIVALSVASNQYTPRILRNFMRDRGTQSVLGVFVAVFTYNLIVMRTIRGGNEPFVPTIAIGVAILLALVSIGFLVYFIHHIAASIQAPTMTSAICQETIDAIKLQFPETSSEQSYDLQHVCERQWRSLPAKETGYLQNVGEELIKLAERNDLVIRIERRIGEFIVKDTPLLSVCSNTDLDETLIRKLISSLAIDNFRTIEQDPSYGIRQLVDIALKALSPGVNDISTAINCVDYLGAILYFLVQRNPAPQCIARNGRPRLIYTQPPNAERMLDQALLQIRQSGRDNPAVLLRLLKVIGATASVARNPKHKEVLLKNVELIEEIADQSIKSKRDQTAVRERVQLVRAQIV